jgi:Zn-dependent protease with chaperone function
MARDLNNPVSAARKSGDTVVLFVTITIVVLAGFLLAENVVEIFAALLIVLLIALFYIKLYQISFLGNAFRVQNGRYAPLKDMVQTIARDLHMPYVDVFITQDPYLNAFAVGYSRPFTIVLHSAIVQELTEAELRAILTHEMAHVKYRHTVVSAYTQPLVMLVPVLGPVTGWIFGFWHRRAELTADRLALAYTKDSSTLINALMKVHIGSKFAEYMQEEGVLYQAQISSGPMRLLAQSLQTHPMLVTRVKEVMKSAHKFGLPTRAAAPAATTPHMPPLQ